MATKNLEFSDVPIDSVAVYLNGAELTRRTEVTLDAPGAHSVRILLPSTDVDLNTCRVAIKGGTAKASITKFDTGSEEGTFVSRLERYPEAKPLYNEFIALCKEQARLLGEQRGLEGAKTNIIKTLQYLRSPACAVPQKQFDRHDKLIDQARSARCRLSERLYENERLRKMNTSAVTAASYKLSEALKSPWNFGIQEAPETWLLKLHQILRERQPIDVRSWVQVNIEAADAGTADLTLTYLVNGASWRPNYDFRITSGQDEELDLTYFAYVHQSSGEDWKNVSLSLHTGSPTTAGSPPSLPQLTVRVKEPPRPVHAGAMMHRGRADQLPHMQCMAQAVVCDEDMGFALSAEGGAENAVPLAAPARYRAKAVMKASARAENEVQSAFEIPKRWDIASGNAAHRFVITQATLTCNILNFCAPEASGVAYRAARVKNTTGFIMMEAPVSVYWDGALIATTHLSTVADGDKFDAFFGQDERVRVEVRPEKINDKTKGMVTSTTVRDVAHTLVLKNQRDQPMRVMFVYRLPVSTSGAIKVVPETSPMTKWEGESDLEALDQVAATEKIQWLHNSVTDHCIGVVRAMPNTSSTLNFKYYVENGNKTPIVIT